MTMRKLFLAPAALVLAAGLASCSRASDAQVQECADRGGAVVTNKFPYEKEQGWFDRSTGKLEYCDLGSGTIGEVYNEQIFATDDGFFGDTGDNKRIFNLCNELGGTTYKTKLSSGKTTHTRFVCVYDGAVRQLI